MGRPCDWTWPGSVNAPGMYEMKLSPFCNGKQAAHSIGNRCPEQNCGPIEEVFFAYWNKTQVRCPRIYLSRRFGPA